MLLWLFSMSVLNLVLAAVVCIFKQIFLGFIFGLFLVCMKDWFLWRGDSGCSYSRTQIKALQWWLFYCTVVKLYFKKHTNRQTKTQTVNAAQYSMKIHIFEKCYLFRKKSWLYFNLCFFLCPSQAIITWETKTWRHFYPQLLNLWDS